MKNAAKVLSGIIIGMALMYMIIKMVMPFDYQYNTEDKTVLFNVKKEIVTDYETVERRFSDEDDYGTTFKVYFEKE